ncbi:hypothetical protein P0O24_00850 [Methanotrichaceae archaeon M04Ac]|uniref:Uncharacterized protein n=1 Tax=Candidatus Methanocrinis alkalitolerans TaxID=3033395 RepID=A0ABT5XBQ3_9EURY|nr:hypothetical protein [Candidatus Methanocrinis alkalitolerans]MDF0592136.1 hypothetical protein [Candidatus Methanocrinis alkalitolerans]
MRMVKWSVIIFALATLIYPCVGLSDVTGTWESSYSFGPVEELMTANIQQVGNNIIGSFSVEVSPSGEEYGGIIFGTIESGKIKAYYLATRSVGGGDPLVTISFTDGRLIDDDTIKGEFYYRDSDSMELSGPYQAERV